MGHSVSFGFHCADAGAISAAPNSAAALSQGIDGVLGDPQLLHRLAGAGRKRAMSFDVGPIAESYTTRFVGLAHGRQMDAATRKSWRETLAKQRSKTLDAPSWLWSSIVDLITSHEAAYLEHCRRYALREENAQ